MFNFSKPINENLYILNVYALELRNNLEHKNNEILKEVNKFFSRKKIDYQINKHRLNEINVALKSIEFNIEDFYDLLKECKEQSLILKMIFNKYDLGKTIIKQSEV